MTLKTEKKNCKMGKSKRKDLIFVCLMLLFPLTQFAVFYLGPNVGAWLMAFQVPRFDGTKVWSVLNFKMFLTDLFDPIAETRIMVMNTFKVFLVSDFVTLPLAILFSYFLYSKIPGHSFFRVVFFLPSIISMVAMTLIFRYFIDVGGPLNQIVALFGCAYPLLLGQGYAFSTVMFYSVWSGLGHSVVLLSGAVGRIPKELFESAEIDGAGYMTVFFSIVLPLIWSTVSMLFVLNVASMFSYMGPILLLTNGAYETSTLAFYIFKGVKQTNSYNYSSAVGLLITLVGTPLVFGCKKLLSKVDAGVEF